VQTLLAQLAETQKQIEKNAQDIVRLQTEMQRLQREGKDLSKVRAMLAEFHAIHMKVLAVQVQLRKALTEIDRA
jgi:hypothetical protein